MLHEARMNFQRTIVNQAPRFPCRGAAQFNHPASLDGERPVLLTFSAHGLAASEPVRSAKGTIRPYG